MRPHFGTAAVRASRAISHRSNRVAMVGEPEDGSMSEASDRAGASPVTAPSSSNAPAASGPVLPNSLTIPGTVSIAITK